MVAHIAAWLKAPIFPDDEHALIAGVLRLLLVVTMVFVALNGVILYFVAPATRSTLWLNVVFVIVSLVTLWIMRRTWVRAAALFVCVFVWVLITGYLCISGGIASPSYGYLYALVPIAMLLFGVPGALAFGVLNIATTFVLYIGATSGWLVSAEPPPSIDRLLVTCVFEMLIMTGTLVIGAHGIRASLNRARLGESRLADRNTELAHRDALMRAVSATTAQLMRSENWEHEVPDVLHTLATVEGCDRAGIALIYQDLYQTWRVSLRFEWYAPDLPPTLGDPITNEFDLKANGYQVHLDRFLQRQPTVVDLSTVSPDSMLPSRKAGIKTEVHSPIYVRGMLWGSLFLSNVRKARVWQETSITALQIAADMLGAVIERREAEEEIREYAGMLERRVEARTAELQIANDELRHLNRVKDEFVSNVSHELRTPITSLRLRYHLISRTPENLNTHLAVLDRETDRLAAIIEDLLALSRIDQSRAKMIQQPLNLATLVSQFAADRVPLAEERGLHMSIDCGSSPLWVMGDSGLLEQALSVLVTNAILYTPTGGTVSIRLIQPTAEHNRICVQVQDNGPGITLAEQARLFTRFFRGEAGQNSGVSGTGLGLALAKEIVNRHNGEITVESEGIPGKGSTFTISLPVYSFTPDAQP